MRQPARSSLSFASIAVACLALAAGPASGESKSVPFDDPAWSIEAQSHELVEYQGRKALHLQGGGAVLPDVSITDGVVEFDIAFGPERGFSGVIFRHQQPGDFENFYLRPHQSGKPDASQYTPVVGGVSGWQLYHSPAYAAPFEYRFGEWMHVTITFSGSRAIVDLDGEVLHVPRLKRPVQAGSVGVQSGFAPAYFTGFRYSDQVPADSPLRTGGEFESHLPELPESLVRTWRVSQAFGADLRPSVTFDDAFRKHLTWQESKVEPEGFVDLAWAEGASPETRCVIAEFTVEATTAGHRLVQFGYSDLARVFVNGVELYRGSNLYQSRDYRYLGTIGLFDAVVIPVHAGSNTVSFVVAENFGGWGVMASVDDVEPNPVLESITAEDSEPAPEIGPGSDAETAKFQNLQVLPPDTPDEELSRLMLANLRGLGLPRLAGEGCLSCHVGSLDTPRSQWDYASDARPLKAKARVMMTMVRDINSRYLPSLDSRIDASFEVTCETCHAGRVDPRPLPDVLLSAHESGGIEAMIARYRDLRERFYGGDAYDFRPQVLDRLASHLADHDAIDDAIRLAEVNAESNPGEPSVRGGWLQLVLERTLDDQGVDAALRQLDELAPTLPPEASGPGLLDSLGWRLNRSERETQGHAILEANLRRFPGEYIPLESVAFIRASAGHLQEAYALLEGWLESHPDHDRARQLLVNLRQRHDG